MSGLYVPDDWDEPTDGYCTMTLTVPNSALWKANMRGAIVTMTELWMWDDENGDPVAAAEQVEQAAATIVYTCP